MHPVRSRRSSRLVALALPTLLCLIMVNLIGAGESPTPAQLEYFETHIRPVLVEHCYACHAADAKNIRGGLLLDTRGGLLN